MASDVVDWDLATAVGRRLAPGGPDLSAQDTHRAVEQLRELAAEAVEPVRERTALVAPVDGARSAVVDRPTWVASNVAGFRVVLEPMLARMRERDNSLVTAIGSRVTALQLGGVLAYLSSKVLGQFEAFSTSAGSPGRLLLVAPNIVATERALDLVPRDFRLWVCLHEETHRVQFGAVPWLTEHLVTQIHQYLALTDIDAGELLRRLRAGAGAVSSAVSGRSGASLLDAAQSPEQRELLDRLTAVMSLLEGHAEFVMDDVGPQVVPSVATIRDRFDARRRSPGTVDGLVRRLLGLDAKLAQYADGA
ncbi:MAG TPA: zinc-dependent metalloprotease, partial [Candidatus Nanopelagicales bacterium]|nr:zinc-dependent metalloprotease [Candidatus Nanopelagicales bacterium]